MVKNAVYTSILATDLRNQESWRKRGAENVGWQFFGTVYGTSTFFPGTAWTNSYDPRSRQWWHLGASKPRMVVIGVSTCYGMLKYKASLLAMIEPILSALTPSDFVNAMSIGEVPATPNCYRDGLVPVTDNVKAEIRTFFKNLPFGVSTT